VSLLSPVPIPLRTTLTHPFLSCSLAGSRPGALLAAAYAVLLSHGVSGYVASTTQIMTSAQAIKHALQTSPVLSADLFVLGDPLVSVIAFSSRTINIMKVGDKMSKRGYHLSQLGGKGGGLHVACTML
jgi:sphinganine-1-phosphate aldolase